ncbi:hypothetical protein L596_003118 [Steinernema carpocapsae]|uniref:Uncharacterized protein n=1 Tax=Steinernema carpocapsae TaxID=34508 RepID=A0A4U8UR55_STECR|nr:hypothetical protein L596_003118 [Steinernema carpocapsae]
MLKFLKLDKKEDMGSSSKDNKSGGNFLADNVLSLVRFGHRMDSESGFHVSLCTDYPSRLIQFMARDKSYSKLRSTLLN